MEKKISVIMPVYNTELYIEKSIKSILSQSFKEFELIIVNDASTDNSLKIIRKLQKEDNRIRVIDLPQNIRQGGARNKGIDIACGEYVCFIDSDDWVEKDMLKHLYSAALKEKSDMIGTDMYYRAYADGNIEIVRENGEKISKLLKSSISGVTLNKEQRNEILFRVGGVCNHLFKLSIIKDNHIRFLEKLSYEDNYFVTLYLMHINKYTYIDKPFYYYRQNYSSTLYRKDNTQLQRLEVEEKLYESVNNRGLYDTYKQGYEFVMIRRWYGNSLPALVSCYGNDADSYIIELYNSLTEKIGSFRNNKYYKRELRKVEKLKIVLSIYAPRVLVEIYKRRNKKNREI